MEAAGKRPFRFALLIENCDISRSLNLQISRGLIKKELSASLLRFTCNAGALIKLVRYLKLYNYI